jgi:TonB family protein
MRRAVLVPTLFLFVMAACDRGDAAQERTRAQAPEPRPDEMPALLNAELPFRYPGALYARKVQGNVMLQLRIDRDGRVVPDSTRLDETSGHYELDSAALNGSRELHFVPAKLHGEPVSVSILFPVYFRHPEARPLPGDTVLQSTKPGSEK